MPGSPGNERVRVRDLAAWVKRGRVNELRASQSLLPRGLARNPPAHSLALSPGSVPPAGWRELARWPWIRFLDGHSPLLPLSPFSYRPSVRPYLARLLSPSPESSRMSPHPDDWTTATASATAALEPASSAAPLERECPHWLPAFLRHHFLAAHIRVCGLQLARGSWLWSRFPAASRVKRDMV